ncbi:dTMP kinase, partial [Frankia sp. Cj3]|uniref:dTMP kinase n=1 Tax=Frankia sp. Cj3 TaxID=2880976 RepID=UPI001EF5019A
PRTEALLYAADRAEHVARVIEPALARGAVVVSDRFIDSSVAYQGAGRQLGADGVAALSRWATQSLVPDITILLDLPAEIGLRRVRERAERNSSTRDPSGPATSPTAGIDRIEAERLAFHERVREGFHRLADSAPGRYVVLDADQPPRTLHNKIRDVINERLRADRDSVAADPPVGPASTGAAEGMRAESMRAESTATEATTAVTAELLPGRPTATRKTPSAR